MAAPKQTLNMAILHEGVQLLDILAVDLLGNISTAYVTDVLAAFAPPASSTHSEASEAQAQAGALLLSQAVDIDFRYVASTLQPTESTAGVKLLPTHTYEDHEAVLADLDVLLVGGPLPHVRPEGSLALMRRFMAKGGGKGGRVLMTTCIGSMWAADAGVLGGRRCTTNRGMLGLARAGHAGTEWVDRRWVVDEGKEGEVSVWSAGGAMAGLDMVASWMLGRFGKEIVLTGLAGLDFDLPGRGEEYGKDTPNGTSA